MKDKKLISTKELSEILGVHIQTIYNWVKEGMPRMKMGYNLVRYDLDEVMKWIENRIEETEDKKIMRLGSGVFFYHEGDNVLRDPKGFIVTKEEFFNMFDAVYETYEEVDESEIERVNENIMAEYMADMKRTIEPREPKPKKTKGYVYFVRADGNYTKVGRTTNLKSRYKSLKTASPNELQMEMYIETNDCIGLEKSIHELLMELDCKVSGEWFDIKEKELKEIHKLLVEKDLEIKMYEGDIK